MSPLLITVSVLAAGYLLGAVPFGLVLTKLAGLGDIRRVGSGNIGATNVLRTGRKDLALATLLLDSGKGALAAWGAALLTADPLLSAGAGAAAFLGHCYPVYLGFQGGKGVATFLGTLVAVNPLVALAAGLAWLITALVLRISSLAALIAALAAPVVAFLLGSAVVAVIISGMSLLIFLRHRANIARLLAGTEPRIGTR